MVPNNVIFYPSFVKKFCQQGNYHLDNACVQEAFARISLNVRNECGMRWGQEKRARAGKGESIL